MSGQDRLDIGFEDLPVVEAQPDTAPEHDSWVRMYGQDGPYFQEVERRYIESLTNRSAFINFTTKVVDSAVFEVFRTFGIPVREDYGNKYDRRDLYAWEDDYDDRLFAQEIAHLSPEEQNERWITRIHEQNMEDEGEA